MAINWVVQILVAVALAAASYLLTPKPKQASPAAAEDLDIPAAREGETIYVLFGTRDIKASNVAWYGHIRTVPIKTKSGKK